MVIDIGKHFSSIPGPRFRKQGAHSGEEFLDTLLKPQFVRAQQENRSLVIRLDGTQYGYPTSFLEQAFGGLARFFGIEEVQARLVFESTDEPMLEEEIRHYIRCAEEKTPNIFDPERAKN